MNIVDIAVSRGHRNMIFVAKHIFILFILFRIPYINHSCMFPLWAGIHVIIYKKIL